MISHLQGHPSTFLEGRGQAQLSQLGLHGVGELLQGPWVQVHSESGFVPCSGIVHFRVLREPSEGKENSRVWMRQLVRRLNPEELMLSNCSVGEDSSESLEQQGDQTSQS